jgi:hypothetical protein
VRTPKFSLLPKQRQQSFEINIKPKGSAGGGKTGPIDKEPNSVPRKNVHWQPCFGAHAR